MTVVELNLPAKESYMKRKAKYDEIKANIKAMAALNEEPVGVTFAGVLEVGEKYVTNEGIVIGPMEPLTPDKLKAIYPKDGHSREWDLDGRYSSYPVGYKRAVMMKWHHWWECELAIKQGKALEYQWQPASGLNHKLQHGKWNTMTPEQYQPEVFSLYPVNHLTWRIKEQA